MLLSCPIYFTLRVSPFSFSDLQIIFLFFLQENNLRKALIPFIGVRDLFTKASFHCCIAPARIGLFFSFLYEGGVTSISFPFMTSFIPKQ